MAAPRVGALAEQQSDASGVQTPATATPPPPDLGAVFRTGATFFGVGVRVMRLELADGTCQRVELPTSKTPALKPTQQKIMHHLRASATPLTRTALAHKCGREDAGGKFPAYVRELIEVYKMVYSNGDEITDDPTKFVTD